VIETRVEGLKGAYRELRWSGKNLPNARMRCTLPHVRSARPNSKRAGRRRP